MAERFERIWRLLEIELIRYPMMKDWIIREIQENRIIIPEEITRELEHCDFCVIKPHPALDDTEPLGFIMFREPSQQEVEIFMIALFEEDENELLQRKIITFFKLTKIKITIYAHRLQNIQFLEERGFERQGELGGLAKLVHRRP